MSPIKIGVLWKYLSLNKFHEVETGCFFSYAVHKVIFYRYYLQMYSLMLTFASDTYLNIHKVWRKTLPYPIYVKIL